MRNVDINTATDVFSFGCFLVAVSVRMTHERKSYAETIVPGVL